ncbi:MAG: hypothetical protein V1818_01855 [Candidatus Aenigmatarchaeota archaeon]
MNKNLKWGLSSNQKKAFEEISRSIGDEYDHGLEDAKGVGIHGDELKTYMTLFVQNKLYMFENDKYTITGRGLILFNQLMTNSLTKGRYCY